MPAEDLVNWRQSVSAVNCKLCGLTLDGHAEWPTREKRGIEMGFHLTELLVNRN